MFHRNSIFVSPRTLTLFSEIISFSREKYICSFIYEVFCYIEITSVSRISFRSPEIIFRSLIFSSSKYTLVSFGFRGSKIMCSRNLQLRARKLIFGRAPARVNPDDVGSSPTRVSLSLFNPTIIRGINKLAVSKTQSFWHVQRHTLSDKRMLTLNVSKFISKMND